MWQKKAKIFLIVYSFALFGCKEFPLFPDIKPILQPENSNGCVKYKLIDRKKVLYDVDKIIQTKEECIKEALKKDSFYFLVSADDLELMHETYKRAREDYEDKK